MKIVFIASLMLIALGSNAFAKDVSKDGSCYPTTLTTYDIACESYSKEDCLSTNDRANCKWEDFAQPESGKCLASGKEMKDIKCIEYASISKCLSLNDDALCTWEPKKEAGSPKGSNLPLKKVAPAEHEK